MKSTNYKLFFKTILVVNFLFLYSCGGVKENIGLIKKSPDEFQVYEKKPLSVPPTFELRPPLDSELATEDSDLDNVIFREEVNTDESLTIGDEVLLISIGEKDTEKDIRKVINNENSISEVKKPLLDKILDFEPIFEGEKKESTINAEEEKKRIEDLKSELKEIKNNLKEDNNVQEAKKNIEEVRPNNSSKQEDEDKSFLDEIFEFDLFSSDDEELESKNQRDKTFWNRKKDKNINNEKEVVSSDRKERIDSSREEDKIIDAIISEKEGSID